MNTVVFVFNLVPAFPLDGGRILRALVWRAAGDKRRGTVAAAQVGRAFAYVLAGLGHLPDAVRRRRVRRAVARAAGVPARPVGARGTRAERGGRAHRGRAGGGHHGPPAGGDPRRRPARRRRSTSTSCATAGSGSRWSTTGGRFLGIARQERAQAAVDAGEGWVTVASVAESPGCRIEQESPISDVLSSESLGMLGALMAVDRDGVLRGVVTVEQVRRALQSALGSAPGRLNAFAPRRGTFRRRSSALDIYGSPSARQPRGQTRTRTPIPRGACEPLPAKTDGRRCTRRAGAGRVHGFRLRPGSDATTIDRGCSPKPSAGAWRAGSCSRRG